MIRNTWDCFFDTSLHTAVRRNSKKTVEFLLKNGADVNATNLCSLTPLNMAVRENSMEIIKILLKNGANVNITDNCLDTPLHTAVRLNLKETVEILLTSGGDVSAKNCQSETPLDIAVHQNSTEIVEILLMNIDNRKLVMKKNPSIFYDVMRNCDERIINLFLESFTLSEVVSSGNVDILKFFLQLKRGLNVNTTTESGEMLLHYAIQCKFEAVSELLLHYGADVNCKDIEGLTALHKAVIYGASTNFIDRLLEKKATLNAKDNYGLTPLSCAIEKRNLEIICFLLDKNPDPHDKDNKLAFCFLFVDDNRFKNIIAIFINRGFTLSVEDFNDVFVPKKLFPSMEDEFKNEKLKTTVQDTLNKTANNVQEFEKLFLLYQVLKVSIGRGFIDIVNNLLTTSVNVNIPFTDGFTMLNLAVKYGHLRIVEKLLVCGADINALDVFNKKSALHFAAIYHREEIATVLLNNCAKFEVRNERNQTPLDCAVVNKSYEVALLLLNAGANVNPDNVKGMNRFLNAARDNLDFTKALLHFGALVDHKNFLTLFAQNDRYSKDGLNRMKLIFYHPEVCSSDSCAVFNSNDFKWSSSKFKRLVIKYVSFHESTIYFASSELELYIFQTKCLEEIEKMKLTQIGGFSVTVDDVLRKTARQIAQYLYNQDFVEALEKMDCRKIFPLYASKIKAHAKKGEVMKRLLELGSTCLKEISKLNLPKLVEDKIISYLNDQELRCLIFALPIDEVKKASIQYKDEFKVDDFEEYDDDEDDAAAADDDSNNNDNDDDNNYDYDDDVDDYDDYEGGVDYYYNDHRDYYEADD